MLSVKDQETSSDPTSVFDLIFTKNPLKIPADAPIYISDTKSLTFGELEYQIRKCAYNLKEKYNIQKGDVVAIRSHSHIHYPVIFHATLFAGGTVALVKHFSDDNVEGITRDLEAIKPKVFITDYTGCEVSLKAAANVGIPSSHILMLGDSNIEKIDCVQSVLLSGENVLVSPYRYTDDELENHPACLCFTSGTTGRPKAVTITTNAMLDTVKDTQVNERGCSRMFTFKSFHSKSSIMMLMLRAITKGNQVYLSHATTADEIYQEIQKYKITFLIGAPYNISAMVLNSEHIHKNYDLSSLNYMHLGGSVATKELVKDASALFGVRIATFYSASELSKPFNSTPAIAALGSIGKLKPGTDIRIVDEEGNDTNVGELLVKGQGVTKGYYNNPEANAKAFTKDGYYRTGDIIKRDENGLFWFLSRCSNLIKCYPTNYYSYEVENVIQTHPKVFECAVIGVFQKKLCREYAMAFVTLIDDYDDKEAIGNDILEYSNKQLCELKQIRCGVVIKKSFDRTSTGKINYAILKQEAEKEKYLS